MSLCGATVILQGTEQRIGHRYTAADERAEHHSSHHVETTRINSAAAVGGHCDTTEIAGDNGILKVDRTGVETGVEESTAGLATARVGTSMIVRNSGVRQID